MHHRRWLRTGSPLGRAGIPVIDRFMAKYNVNVDTGCWEWRGALDSNGYGIFTIDGRNTGAHRWSYEHHVGPVATGLHIDHLCRARHCVNPAHLEPVTPQTNILRGVGLAAANARKTRCPQGHPYDHANTHWYDGRRYCRECRRDLDARRSRR